MAKPTPDKLYIFHCKHLRILDDAIEQIQIDLRRHIAFQQESGIYGFTKIFSHLITSWTEVRVLKLAYEPNAFSADQIVQIQRAGKLEDKWITALKIGTCNAYKVAAATSLDDHLTFTARARYHEIERLIQTELSASITIRNRIAHGQWYYAFNSDLSDVSPDLTKMLRGENIVSLQLRLKMFKSLSQLIHDLAVSKRTFDRDFDDHHEHIERQLYNAHKRDYAKYAAAVVAKYHRGLQKRRRQKEAAALRPGPL